MDARELRGLQIAATTRLSRGKDGFWRVPSQTGNGTVYTVRLDTEFCSCPDRELHQVKCKHLYAVEFTIRREVDTEKQTETVTVTATQSVRLTYTQDWRAYNAAQTEEKERFAGLLASLCSTVPQPPQALGRPRLPLADMVFACAFKVYTGFSSRRFASDLRHTAEENHIDRTPHFNSVLRYLADPALTPVLKGLVTTSSLPLKAVETDFAVDSSGFSTSRFIRWYNKKYGREVDNRQWVKAHLMAGVKTKIVAGVEISGWAANDTLFFKPLVEGAAQHFRIVEVSADKAYSSHSNLALVEAIGGTAFVPFKNNTFPIVEDDPWGRMYHYFLFNRQQFLEHYHKRSNVETVFSMVKGKFGDAVRSRTDTGQVNEVLCKVLAHNICVVNQAMHELGIEPTFGAETALAPQVVG